MIPSRTNGLLLGTSLALAIACGVLLATRVQPVAEDDLRSPSGPNLSPEELAMVIEALSARVDGFYDSHPDGEVGRVLLPRYDGEYATNGRLRTNAYGMREDAYALPKPADTLRVVVLGDSFVFGWQVDAEERLGVVLEQRLQEVLPVDGPRVECLHIAVPSWNVRSACAYLLAQLDQLQPDLVVHVSAFNDLDDVTGVRGFGTQARFAPARRALPGAFVSGDFLRVVLGFEGTNLLHLGLDGESRRRYREAGAAIDRLRGALRRLPQAPPYLLVAHWGPLLPSLHRHLGESLPAGERLYLPLSFFLDPDNAVGFGDVHWNARGHERVADAIFGRILELELLSELDGAAGPSVTAALAASKRLHEAGEAEALQPGPLERELLRPDAAERYVDRVLEVASLDLAHALQIYGGLDREGHVSPEAVVLLRCAGARRLRVTGRALPDTVLEDCTVRVRVDDVEIGSFALHPDEPIAEVLELPPELVERTYVAVRFEADGYVLRGAEMRDCISWRLDRIALEP